METDNQRFNAAVQPNSAFLAELKEKLPEFFTRENAFDLEKFQAALKEKNVSELSEGYQLNFIGKDYARRQAGEMPTTVIVPDEDQNNGAGKNSQNLFFTGDNLEVLRHLQNNYQNKIDVIYIDPPYNTGSDGFVYPDSFEYSDDKLKEMFGMNDDQVARLKSIQGKASHSAWLTFMYPRLALAKRLLANDGVIFISIDDNEQSNLKELMDEILGETNFIANMIIDGTPKNDPLMIATSHEYVLVYTKNINKAKLISWGLKNPFSEELNKLVDNLDIEKAQDALMQYYKKNNLTKENISNYKFVDRNGIYRIGPLDDPQGKGPHDKRINKKTGNWLKIPSRGWRCTIETWNEWDKQNLIFYPNTDDKLPSKKTYLSTDKLEVGRSVIKIQTRKTTNYLTRLFGIKKIFNNPKPLELLRYLLNLANPNITVLDFFAGSSTTADAVMQLNAEDGGHRKFIMVQLPEKTYHTNSDGSEVPTKGGKAAYEAGFRSIDEISRERIRRAAAKIKADNELTLPADFDGSFKHYRVVKPSRMTLDRIEEFKPETDELVLDTVDSFSSQTLGVAGNASGEQTVLATWLAKDGYPFDVDVQKIDLAGYQGNLIENNRLYLIREDWSSKCTEKLLNLLGTHTLNLQAVVILGYSFNLNDLRELENGLKQLDGNVSLIKRY